MLRKKIQSETERKKKVNLLDSLLNKNSLNSMENNSLISNSLSVVN
jgi:hypothetical protein